MHNCVPCLSIPDDDGGGIEYQHHYHQKIHFLTRILGCFFKTTWPSCYKGLTGAIALNDSVFFFVLEVKRESKYSDGST